MAEYQRPCGRGGGASISGLAARAASVSAGWDDALAEHRPPCGQRPAGVEAGARIAAARPLQRQRPPATAEVDPRRQIEALLDEAEGTPEASRRAEILAVVAGLFESKLGDADRAFTTLVASYRQAPRRGLLDELERLGMATSRWSELAEELGAADRSRPTPAESRELRLRALRQGGRWRELAEALATRAHHERDPRSAAKLLLDAGDIVEAHLGDADRAIGYYRQAIAADQSLGDAWLALDELGRRRCTPDLVVDALAGAGDRVRAVRRYAVARADAERCDGDAGALPALDRLHSRGGLTPREEIACLASLVNAEPAERRVEHLARLGDLYLEALDDPVEALAAFRGALALRPDDHRLLHRCLEIHAEQKQWQEALSMLDRLIARDRETSTRARYQLAAATICRDELAELDRAVRYLMSALENDARLDRARLALERLLAHLGRWQDLAACYARALERLGPEAPDGHNAERLRQWRELARLYLAEPATSDKGQAALAAASQLATNAIAECERLAEAEGAAGNGETGDGKRETGN